MLTKSRRYDLLPIQDRAVEEQQRIAEIFFRLGLIPDRIWIEDVIWKQKLDLSKQNLGKSNEKSTVAIPQV